MKFFLSADGTCQSPTEMMKSISLDKTFRLFDNGGVFLVSSCFENDGDVMPIAWCCPVGLDKVVAMVSPGHYTRSLIDKSGYFALMVPTGSMAQACAYLGTTSKHHTRGKLAGAPVRFSSDNEWSIPLIDGCAAYSVFEVIPTNLPGPVCGKALLTVADEELFDTDHWISENLEPKRRNLRYSNGGRWYVAGQPMELPVDWVKPV